MCRAGGEERENKIGGIEQAVGRDRGAETAGLFIEENEHQGKGCQRHEGKRVEVHYCEHQGGNPAGGAGKAVLFDGWIEDAPEEDFLGHRRDEDGKETDKDQLARGKGVILQGGDNLLLGRGVPRGQLDEECGRQLQGQTGGQEQ